jgi:hypothetical protein
MGEQRLTSSAPPVPSVTALQEKGIILSIVGVGSVLLYIFGFALGLGAVQWVVVSHSCVKSTRQSQGVRRVTWSAVRLAPWLACCQQSSACAHRFIQYPSTG